MSNSTAQQIRFRSWICRISVHGVHFDSKPGTEAQAEMVQSIARANDSNANFCIRVINLVDEPSAA